MPPTFIGCAVENFRPGRPGGFRPDAIVLHRSGGSRESWRARFNDPAAQQSAHYVVGRDGSIDQYVLEGDTAFHAGLVVGATWKRLQSKVNPNFYTLGVELEGGATDDWPDAQVGATARLVADLAGRWQFAIDAEHVVGHSAIRATTRCPADTCPIGTIIERARAATRPLLTPRDSVVRTLSRTNLRRGAPSVHAPIARVLAPETELRVDGFVDNGEPVQGNAFWYCDDEDGFFWAGATDLPHPVVDDGLGGPQLADDATTDPMELESRVVRPTVPPVPVAGNVDRSTFVLPPKEFAGDVIRKDLIVLHFTAGTTARSAFQTWRNDPQRVATAYLVDVDGTIYEVFPPQFWAAHLGIKGSKNAHDKRSIGIEIANVGPLQPSSEDPSALNWWPKKSKDAPEFTTRFCGLDETDRYVATPYRGKSHFASYPDVQVDAVAALVRGLCEQFSIRKELPPEVRRFECDPPTFASYKGVCSHANFRTDKWDIGPAFPWERLAL
jgi:N-acetyl-anhydromuramyl-L-alanine amidase AmpD